MRLLPILRSFLPKTSKNKANQRHATQSRTRHRHSEQRFSRFLFAEQLESRDLLAADLIFSEVLYDPNTFTGFNDRYFEVRGTPNATIPQNTYMLVVDTDALTPRPGQINTRFDLSGLSLGSNGHLVIAQGPNNYTFDPESTSYSGNDGFAGLPTSVYASETSGGSDRFENTFASNTFMLVEAPNEPAINEDFDADDDGVLDGDALGWTIHDAITVNGHFQGGNVDDKVYGGILIRTEGNSSTAPSGVPTVDVAFAGYFARVGDRTGYAPEDFVVGQVTLASDGLAPNIESIEGNEVYREYAGARLDHLGGANFFSTVTGIKFDDVNGNGVQDPGESPVAGATVYVDVNGNGQLDDFVTTVEPDDFPDGYEMMKVAPGVTLTAEGSDLLIVEEPPTSGDNPNDATTGTRRFEVSTNALRLDFVDPVKSISVDASNLSSSISRVGEMTAYDVNGNLLTSVVTSSLSNEFQTMTITRTTADIAMVRANFRPIYGSVSRLDNIRFTRPEPSAVSDATGLYVVDDVDLHIDGTTTATLRTVGETGGETLVFDKAQFFGSATTGTGETPDSIIGRTSGEWWLAKSDAVSFMTEFFGQWSDIAWDDTAHGDFDGDGVLDLAGRIGREWWVSLSDANGISGTQFWGNWPVVPSWTDVTVADVNGDGLDDILGRNDGGAWWVARSTGASFAIEQWSHWSLNVTWDDTSVGDFNGDGMSDLAGRVNGTWYVDLSNGQSFDFQQWGSWSNAVTWEDVRVGDFNGDGNDDIAGRANGNWWLAQSTGSSFQSTYWGNWSNSVTWEDVVVGDFDGDDLDDIAGRANGQWWLANSTGSFFTVPYWGQWSNAVVWEDVQVGDFNGDGNDDIAGRTSGNWWVARSADTFFITEYWGNWSSTANWEAVNAGVYTDDGVNGLSVQLSAEDGEVSEESVLIGEASNKHVLDNGVRVRRGGRFQ